MSRTVNGLCVSVQPIYETQALKPSPSMCSLACSCLTRRLWTCSTHLYTILPTLRAESQNVATFDCTVIARVVYCFSFPSSSCHLVTKALFLQPVLFGRLLPQVARPSDMESLDYESSNFLLGMCCDPCFFSRVEQS